MEFKLFPSFDEVKTDTESDVQIVVRGQGEDRFLCFDKPVRLIEIKKLEALKIAFALLGRVAICEVCGTAYRRKASVGDHAKTRFCSKKCYHEWCRRTGGPVFGRHRIIETDNGFEMAVKEKTRKTPSREELSKRGRKGGKTTQRLHPEVRQNLKNQEKRR